MTDLPPPALDQIASRVATAGVVAGLALTAVGMVLRSPVAGAAALVILAVMVMFRRPIARLIARAKA